MSSQDCLYTYTPREMCLYYVLRSFDGHGIDREIDGIFAAFTDCAEPKNREIIHFPPTVIGSWQAGKILSG